MRVALSLLQQIDAHVHGQGDGFAAVPGEPAGGTVRQLRRKRRNGAAFRVQEGQAVVLHHGFVQSGAQQQKLFLIHTCSGSIRRVQQARVPGGRIHEQYLGVVIVDAVHAVPALDTDHQGTFRR